MPHHKSHERAREFLEEACARLQITYISPLEDTETVIRKIAGADRLITEALHGAVTAESYNVPWTPVVFSHNVLPIKWRDFTASIGTTYSPVDISTNLAFEGEVRTLDRLKYQVSRWGLGKAKYRYLPVRKIGPRSLDAFTELLATALKHEPVRTDAELKRDAIRRLDDGISKFQDLLSN